MPSTRATVGLCLRMTGGGLPGKNLQPTGRSLGCRFLSVVVTDEKTEIAAAGHSKISAKKPSLLSGHVFAVRGRRPAKVS